MSLEFRMLGPLDVRRRDTPVDLGPPKQRAVLALLLAAAPRAVAVHELVEQIWGAGGPADPLRSVQVYVSNLRKVLGSPELIAAAASGYQLVVEGRPVDLHRFEQEAERASTLLRRGLPDEALRAAKAALAWWRGPAWQDLRHLPAIDVAAAQHEQARLDTEMLAARASLATGRHHDAVGWLQRMVDDHPLHEGLRELLMLALHRSGRRADALTVFARGRELSVRETGLDPGEPLQRLQQAILADDPALRVEDVELRARRHLPAAVTSLVGRDREAGTLRGLLGTHRLVTLVGPGGVGKTRLALHVAHESAQDFPDGVWFVDLSALTDPATVGQTIADTLDVEARDDIESALKAWLAARTALLVLDNFEQVADAAPLVGALAAAGEGVHVLVTSRVRLHLYGELLYRVEPLALEWATRLLTERAHSVAPWFGASRDDDVRRLCSALDGLPLALELVAARADEVHLDRMLEQLGERLTLASHGPRDRPERHRSLRAAIEWSVRLLDERAVRSFARLSVFAGGFTRESAAAVAEVDALPVLVRANLVAEAGDRFRMLETIRDYAGEIAGDELADAQEAHARWCLDLAAEASAGLASERRRWLTILRSETGNLRAGLAYLEDVAEKDEPHGTRLLQLAVDLGAFWFRTAPGSEDVQWLHRGLAASPDGAPVLRARAWYGLAICHAEQGQTVQAIEFGRQALALLRPGLDDAWRARALNTVAGLTRDLGRAAEALPLMEESLALRRRLADPTLTLLIPLLNLGLAATDVGDTSRARRALVEAEAEARDDLEQAIARGRLAGVALAEQRPEEVARLLSMVVPVLQAEEERYRLVETLEQLAGLAALLDRGREAAVLLAAADRAMTEDGSRLVPADVELRARRTGPALATLDGQELAEARREGELLDLDAALDRALRTLGCSSPPDAKRRARGGRRA